MSRCSTWEKWGSEVQNLKLLKLGESSCCHCRKLVTSFGWALFHYNRWPQVWTCQRVKPECELVQEVETLLRISAPDDSHVIATGLEE